MGERRGGQGPLSHLVLEVCQSSLLGLRQANLKIRSLEVSHPVFLTLCFIKKMITPPNS